MDGGPSAGQRRVLVRLAALAALSLPVAGLLTALPGQAEWRWGDRLSFAGASAVGVSALLLAIALVAALGDGCVGGRTLRGDVRWMLAIAGVAVCLPSGWLATTAIFDRGWYGVSFVDDSLAAQAGRKVWGLAVGLTAAAGGLVAIWMALDTEEVADDA